MNKTSLFGLLLVFVVSGCLSQTPPVAIRFFHPQPPQRPTTEPEDATPKLGVPLHMGRVTAAVHLRERMVWRVSDVEIGLDERNRWASQPEALVAAVLKSALYQSQRFVPLPTGNPSIEAHLEAFEARLPQQDAYVSAEHVRFIAIISHNRLNTLFFIRILNLDL